MVKTKSIYDAPSKDDGLRVLVTRYWPRGVRKDEQDFWIRDLGPGPALIKAWKSGAITWNEFRRSYLDEYGASEKKTALKSLKDIIKATKGRDVTLLCTCREEGNCHRGLLKDMVKRKKA
ncbi:MAG: DUF488 family protein [Deltaproteobacteria bacterium]|nr:DUF488 family protein [Deltaproteobacteria bacterium]